MISRISDIRTLISVCPLSPSTNKYDFFAILLLNTTTASKGKVHFLLQALAATSILLSPTGSSTDHPLLTWIHLSLASSRSAPSPHLFLPAILPLLHQAELHHLMKNDIGSVLVSTNLTLLFAIPTLL